jgi:Leucine-rich repeat (LRR) protein
MRLLLCIFNFEAHLGFSAISIESMKKIIIVLFILVTFNSENLHAQVSPDTSIVNKEYTSIEEALKNPEKVYRLNLSNQNISLAGDKWTMFKNLQYLSLKDDHLKTIPVEIGNLENLRVLDLSGNDFELLPATFSNLKKLEELILNDEKNFKIDSNMDILATIPNLRILHLENDHLDKLPINFSSLKNLEKLYLNNNEFTRFPTEIKGLKNLKYIDIHQNRIPPNRFQNIQQQNMGIQIVF